MIPDFDERGFLPKGVHHATWEQFRSRYSITPHRARLIDLLEKLARHLAAAGCQALYVDGSFVTSKERPGDYDACWDPSGVKHDRLDPLLMLADDASKAAMAMKYGGDIRISSLSFGDFSGRYLEFFQQDRDGKPKGIVVLDLAEFGS